MVGLKLRVVGTFRRLLRRVNRYASSPHTILREPVPSNSHRERRRGRGEGEGGGATASATSCVAYM